MSRVGKLPIVLPAGVTLEIAQDNTVKVKGAKGELTQKFDGKMEIKNEEGTVTVARPDDQKQSRATHGLTRALLANMVKGVSEGFEKTLEIVGVGYRVALNGKKLTLNLGYSHPVEFEQPAGITFEVPNPNSIIIKGTDRQQVGQVAANIREKRAPEPYKGKGIKYKGEYIRRKEGKSGMK